RNKETRFLGVISRAVSPMSAIVRFRLFFGTFEVHGFCHRPAESGAVRPIGYRMATVTGTGIVLGSGFPLAPSKESSESKLTAKSAKGAPLPPPTSPGLGPPSPWHRRVCSAPAPGHRPRRHSLGSRFPPAAAGWLGSAPAATPSAVPSSAS